MTSQSQTVSFHQEVPSVEDRVHNVSMSGLRRQEVTWTSAGTTAPPGGRVDHMDRFLMS